MRRVLISTALALAVQAFDLWAWARSTPGAEVSALGLLATMGSAAAVGMLLGAGMTLLHWAVITPGPARDWLSAALPPPSSVQVLVRTVLLIATLFVLGCLVRVRLRDWPAARVLTDVAVLVAMFFAARSSLSHARLDVGSARRLRRGAGALLGVAVVVALVLCGLSRPRLVPELNVRQIASMWDVVIAIGTLALVSAALLVRPGFPARGLGVAAGGAAALATAGLLAAHASSDARQGAWESTRPAFWTLALAKGLDRDGDGFSALLGGGDCDDGNAAVHPDARERPGDGRDQSCRGGDEPSPFPKAGRPSFVPLPSGIEAPRHIVLVTVDALRADHLSLYDYRRLTSPRIDRWARGAVVYERAYTPAPLTHLAIPILLTGRLLPRILWNRDIWPWRIRDQTGTLAEQMVERGWRTGAVVTHTYMARRVGWTRGFEIVDETILRKGNPHDLASAADVTARGLRFLAARLSHRTFLWLHYFDPHARYLAHADGPRWGDRDVDRYDQEIRYTDSAFGELLDGLDRLSILSSTAVLFLSDHGEEFGEHGRALHGAALWEELARIPLIVSIPGATPSLVRCTASGLDVPTTIANLAGWDAGAEGFSGATLLADLGTGCDASREVVSEIRYAPQRLRALIGARFKLVENVTAGTARLFDLAGSSGELRDVRRRHPAVFNQMRRRLGRWVETIGAEQ